MRCALGSAVGAAVLLGWLGSVASGVQQPPDTTVRARMEAALAHLAGGEAEAAIPLLLSVVDEVPDHGPARLQLGALAIGRREWGVAEDHLRIALAATGPDAPPGAVPAQRPGLAWALLAEALDGRGELAEALRATEEAVRLAPTFVPALLRRSDLARRLASDPDASAAWTPLRVGWAETALETARAAVDLLPERPGPWTALALAALGSQADDLAQCAARRAAGLATQDPAAWLLLARATARSDESAALEFAERALEAGGEDDPGAWMLLGELRAFRMDLEGSLAAYAEALRRDPAAAGEIASPALDALAARQDAELLALLAERADRVPGALNTRFTLAKHALREGRATEALELLRRLAALRPDHAAILAALHTALRQAGDPAADEALRRLDAVKAAEAAAWERANAQARLRRRAREALERGEFQVAADAWEELLDGTELAEDDQGASDHAGLGRALTGLGQGREALAAFEASLALRPFDPAALEAATSAAGAAGASDAPDRYAARAALAAADCDVAR